MYVLARTAAIFALPAIAFAQFPVTGRIVDDLSGAPVANARVGLLNEAFEVPPMTRTGSDGRFTLSVPAGNYKLAVEKSGFFAYPNDVVEVRDGKPGELSLVLVKMRSVSGRVLWRDGQPATGLILGQNVLGRGAGGTIETRIDSDGRFIGSGLRPGRYSITIDPAFGGSAGRVSGTRQYPTADEAAAGQSIDLRYVAERSLGDVYLDEIAGVELEGRLQITDKISMTGGASIDLASMTANGVLVNVSRASGPRNGTFRFPKVAPGTYYLIGNTQVPNYVVFGVQSIQVGSTPIRDIAMVLPDAPPKITGRFEVETPQGLSGVARVLVASRLAKPALGNPGKQTEADGRFEIYPASSPGGILGPYQLVINSGIPPDAYIANVTQGELRATRDPFVMQASPDPVNVLLKRDGAKIRGRAAVSGNPPRPAYIVLAPKEHEATLFYKTIPTDRDGVFALQGIAPGTYDLFAFDRQENYAGEQTLRKYAQSATPVTVAAGTELTMNLNVVRIEQ